MVQATTRWLAGLVLLSLTILVPAARRDVVYALGSSVTTRLRELTTGNVELLAHDDLGAEAITRQDDYIYIDATILDVSNPARPRQVGSVPSEGFVLGIEVAGSYAYLAVPGGLRVVDVSNPSHRSSGATTTQDALPTRMSHSGVWSSPATSAMLRRRYTF